MKTKNIYNLMLLFVIFSSQGTISLTASNTTYAPEPSQIKNHLSQDLRDLAKAGGGGAAEAGITIHNTSMHKETAENSYSSINFNPFNHKVLLATGIVTLGAIIIAPKVKNYISSIAISEAIVIAPKAKEYISSKDDRLQQ